MTSLPAARARVTVTGVRGKRGVTAVRMHSTQARWVIPAGIVAVVGIVVGATAAASAAVPSLPPKTAAQLLAQVAAATRTPAGPLTATVQQTTNLGLPQLPAEAQTGVSSSLLSGTQSVDIWYADPQHLRIAVPVQAGESDLRRDGTTLWLWNSTNQTATEVVLPAGIGRHASSEGSAPPQVPATPRAAAGQILTAIGRSTVVSVQSNVYVANRPAYQLSLVPKSSRSLVGRVLLAIDASRGIPLRLEVYGRGSVGLAYSIGYTSLTFGTPSAANFSFTPPPGATVRKETGPANPGPLLRGLGLPAGAQSGTASASGTGKPKVIGSGWLSVVGTPANPEVSAAVHQLVTDHSAGTNSNGGGFFGSSSSAASGQSGKIAVPVGPLLAPLQSLLLATKPVSGSWGSGRLLQTTLLSVLVTSSGQILAGAVSPAVLYADVARDAG